MPQVQVQELEEAERKHTQATRRLETARDAIEDAKDGDDLGQLERDFDGAVREHEKTERRLRVIEARANSPVDPVGDDGSSSSGPDFRSRAVRVTNEPLTYEKHNGNSFFHDLYASTRFGDQAAAERLARHRTEVRVETRALNSTDGTGGDFVPPLWLMDEWIALARAGRPFADAINHLPLPPNTDSINLPKVLTGSATNTQSDGGSVQSTDPGTGSVAVPVKTIAGQVDMSRQFFERSLPGADVVVGGDLVADYATKVDVQVLNGSGSGSNCKGVLQDSNTQTVTFTSGTPTVAGLYPKLANAGQLVQTSRFLPATLVAMHPRRWAWILAAVDSSGRPFATEYGQQNAVARLDQVAAENVVGSIQGLPVLVDSSIPTNLGGGTNEDRIIVTRASDLYLFEDPLQPTVRVFEDVLSGTLSVRVQAYGYIAFSSERYSPATAVISGTGLAAPSF